MSKERTASFWDRTLSTLRGAFGDRRFAASPELVRPDLSGDGEERVRRQIQDCLGGPGGEVTARARAVELGRTYLSLDGEGRRRFLHILAFEFNTDPDKVNAGLKALEEVADDPDQRRKAEQVLRRALEPAHMRLFTQFNDLEEGVKFLVDLRADVCQLVDEAPAFRALDADLKELLATWFDVGFLELRQITWQSPAALLEKLIEYEAVHQIRDWGDLKNRLDPDRRCFAFFHPNMPGEPLIFVEVALIKGMADSVQALLDPTAPIEDVDQADTAIFYSISNAQAGLVGISFGNFLIKGVVDELTKQHPALRNFATLSPIPGFRRWLDAQIAAKAKDLLLPAERRALVKNIGTNRLDILLRDEAWPDNEQVADTLKAPLMRLAARYLAQEKGRNGRSLDPVAHFHLSNGARMERLNWLGDRSPAGLSRSAGMMINYLYALHRIDANHEAYTASGRVALSGGMKALLK
ncbi:MAG: malonyl-CoA decarboxylase [Alphaproteobacteria bacterium]|nr:malonyl-CoA decarboxylase [Alphaproteobacteria bacterium]